ncbi:hypothetical protein L227DRAFT_611676 [Lentinus tigrinus ALCF2SS1-6]|uniref:Uncharacterized protein n=1 Tax=Lentinus tigrinus ALCF2SS1-6 TaxID=1328759 RepID=A0A5C2S9E4_9APHY|nr:hypothetical protein L227DRAFT_611676 [Lentinus tigrinus ALCF2SS1-6]
MALTAPVVPADEHTAQRTLVLRVLLLNVLFWVTGCIVIAGHLWLPRACAHLVAAISARRKVKSDEDDVVKERRRMSSEIVLTLADAGVSRDVIAYAISVTDYPLDIADIEVNIEQGATLKALNATMDAHHEVLDTQVRLERTQNKLLRELERKKARLDRVEAYYRTQLDVANLTIEMRQLQGQHRS